MDTYFFAGPLSGLEQAEVIFAIGTEPAQTAPVLDYYLKRSVRKGIPLIVAHLKKTELAERASVWIHPSASPLSKHNYVDPFYLELINIISARLIAQKGADTSFISRFTKGYEDFETHLTALDQDASLKKAQLDSGALQTAVDLLIGRKITFVVGDGLMLQRYGREAMEALLNLALMTGSIGYRGAGFHIVSKENNLVGAWDMGTVPRSLPGRLLIDNKAERQIWEKAWRTKIPTARGLDLYEMIHKAEKGSLKAIYIMGENPLRSLPQPEHLLQSFKKLECIVVQDILFNETVNIADVVLPGAAFSEKTGSFTNLEGKVQCFPAAVPPPGEAKSDLEILGLLAEKMGAPAYRKTHKEIRKEISSAISAFSETEACKHPIWIREKSSENFSLAEQQIRFSPVVRSKETKIDEGYPFIALFGSLRYHLGSGTRTEQSPRIQACQAKGEIEVSPSDAEKMDLLPGDRIKVLSATGQIERTIQINSQIHPGFLHIPTAFNSNDARCLIRLMPLTDAHSSGWDWCQVAVAKADREKIEKEEE